ncbi:hypothetical protein IMCC3317_36520 [Kordia antarctica]|uniref:DoxX family protein n=1 Tax=Kordia antarctica TaxID=1218801 RepID=A0A7L4ZNM2_9FLAO|nr:hypothetical protein [Kordia antarctica]QHI38262.1 hypothetical protein IMCC3317_36520 [Kordia antarctica]
MFIQTSWNIFQKIGFRFCVIYTLLFALPFPLIAFTFLDGFTDKIDDILWSKIVPYIGETVFNVTIDSSAAFSGSGDTTYDYVQVFCYFLVALLGTLIWSILDRKRPHYWKLLRILVVYITYYLIFFMLVYGFMKVYKLQFPDPRLTRLIQPYGDSSPMGIAWTFMGASKFYTFFAGLSEVLGGLLLISRRTRTFGAFVCVGVMLNVFVMNMSYDIPVKLFSFHLLLFSLFIFLQDWKRVFAVFFTTATTIPRSFPHYFKKRKLNIGLLVIKICFISFLLYSNFSRAIGLENTRGSSAPKPAMYGIYDLKQIVKNNDTIPLIITDKTLWKRIVIQRERHLSIFTMEDEQLRFSSQLDTVYKTLSIDRNEDSYKFKYVLKDSILSLKGTHNGDSIFMEAKQFDLKKFRLINRGFHWINESPYNR